MKKIISIIFIILLMSGCGKDEERYYIQNLMDNAKIGQTFNYTDWNIDCNGYMFFIQSENTDIVVYKIIGDWRSSRGFKSRPNNDINILIISVNKNSNKINSVWRDIVKNEF